MRDWRKADDYRFPKDFKHYRWAWEFLRRNPDYRRDWEEALVRFKAGDVSVRRHSDPDSQEFYLPVDQKAKWSLASGLLNPDVDSPQSLGFSVGYGKVVYFAEDFDIRPDPVGPRYPWAAFDIHLPIKPQIESVERSLKEEQKRREIRPKKPKPHRNLWPLYLRLLDAEIDRRIPRQIADFLSEENAAGSDPGKIWDQLQAARRMTLPEGYLSIFLAWSDLSEP